MTDGALYHSWLRLQEPYERLVKFIHMRQFIRDMKDVVGWEGPFTSDPILNNNRFCNIDREHDTVTRWIKANVRDIYDRAGPNVLVPQVLAARVFNEPSSLQYVLPVEDVDETMANLARAKEAGLIKRTLRGAYMMPVHGKDTKGVSAVRYYVECVIACARMNWMDIATLQGLADQLIQLHGVGPFVANQVVTDLRYTSWWADAPDWETFVMCGPGTIRGMNRLEGRAAKENVANALYKQKVLDLRERLRVTYPQFVATWRDPNNVCNTLCEFDKYERLLWGESSRLRSYP